MIRTVDHESHLLLEHILKFYLSRNPSHSIIDHRTVIIILINLFAMNATWNWRGRPAFFVLK